MVQEIVRVLRGDNTATDVDFMQLDGRITGERLRSKGTEKKRDIDRRDNRDNLTNT